MIEDHNCYHFEDASVKCSGKCAKTQKVANFKSLFSL